MNNPSIQANTEQVHGHGDHLTGSQAALSHIRLLAQAARRDLSENANKGSTARPTVAQLNRTLDRLAAIEEAADLILGGAV